MLRDGIGRAEEYIARIDGIAPADAPEDTRPLALQALVREAEHLESAIQALTARGDEDRSRTRMTITEAARRLQQSEEKQLRRIGDQLLDVVDQQVVHNSLSWEEFLRSVKQLLGEARQWLLETAKEMQ